MFFNSIDEYDKELEDIKSILDSMGNVWMKNHIVQLEKEL